MEFQLFHPLVEIQFHAGWILVLAGLVSGALLGLGFHREDFLGGYASLRRRLVRLGHIALVALGGLNVLWALSVDGMGADPRLGLVFLAGSLAMPLACFVVAARIRLRPWFALPVVLLTGSLAAFVAGGPA